MKAFTAGMCLGPIVGFLFGTIDASAVVNLCMSAVIFYGLVKIGRVLVTTN